MKKYLLSISLIILLITLTACKKDIINDTTLPTPTIKPTETVPVVTETPVATTPPTKENTFTIQDYYPFQEDAEYIYEGLGNEYAAMNVWTDYNDASGNRIQTRTDNGGTETVRVIEIKDGKLTVISSIGECYYRDYLLDAEVTNEVEVLLMEPLVKGTEWTLPDNRKRYISNAEVTIETPLGTYQALEVTTESTDSKTLDYYAPKVGLVKTIFLAGDSEISTSLKEIKTDTPFSKYMEFYYPDEDEKIYTEQKTLHFHTNDNTAIIIENAVKEDTVKGTYLPLISADTKIRALYLGKDSIAYIDFSKEFVEDMNVGASYETLILQCITNTLGNYYGVQKVIITVDNKPYESGHVAMEEGEAFTVDMDKVVSE